MSETLEVLFGSKAKTRILRCFLLNPETEFSATQLAKKNMLTPLQVRKELNVLKKIRFVNQKNRRKQNVYSLNNDFHFCAELKSLFAKSNSHPQSKNLSKIKMIGDVRLVLISGIFLNYSKGKVDMILVINNVDRAKLKKFMSALEAEIGREVGFVLMNTDEFKYRLDMLDRFLIDFLEGPYSEIVNKIPGLKRFVMGLRK